jgi:predicted RNA binding protein YcfA (HicA-like mRNA interferase family)
VKRVSWQNLRDVCKLAGCVEARTRGDHLVMTRPGLARPVIIKMDRDLGEDLVRSNIRTLGLSRKEFERLLAIVRGHDR